MKKIICFLFVFVIYSSSATPFWYQERPANIEDGILIDQTVILKRKTDIWSILEDYGYYILGIFILGVGTVHVVKRMKK